MINALENKADFIGLVRPSKTTYVPKILNSKHLRPRHHKNIKK